MNFRTLKAFFAVSFALFLPIAAIADDPAPAAADDPAPAAAAPAEDPAPAPSTASAPQFGPFRVDSVSGSVGGTESGFAVGAGVAVSTEGRQEEFVLEMYNGHPVLRLQIEGRSRRLDVNLFRKEWTTGTEDDPQGHELNIELRTLQAEGDISIPVGGNFRGRLVITPEVAAAYSLGVDKFNGTAEIFIGAAGGVAGESEGAGGVLGIRVGARLRAEYAIDDDNKIRGGFELDQTINLLPGLNIAPQITGSLGYEHLIRDSEGRVTNGFGIDLAARTDAYNVERNPDLDSGRNTFIGLRGTYTFGAF